MHVMLMRRILRGSHADVGELMPLVQGLVQDAWDCEEEGGGGETPVEGPGPKPPAKDTL